MNKIPMMYTKSDKQFFCVFYIVLVFLVGCSTSERKNDVLYRLNAKYSKKFKMEYQKTSKLGLFDKYIDTLSNDIFTFINEDDSLRLLFEKYGVESPATRTKFLMFCWHDQLSGQKNGLRTYLEGFKSYHENLDRIGREDDKIAKFNYERFNVGDSITIVFPIEVKANSSRCEAIVYGDPYYQWDYDPENNLRIDGVVIKKRIQYVYRYLDLKIFRLNRTDTWFFMTQYEEGDTFSISTEMLPSAILLYSKRSIDTLAPLLFKRRDSVY